jgi:hypothetical protein
VVQGVGPGGVQERPLAADAVTGEAGDHVDVGDLDARGRAGHHGRLDGGVEGRGGVVERQDDGRVRLTRDRWFEQVRVAGDQDVGAGRRGGDGAVRADTERIQSLGQMRGSTPDSPRHAGRLRLCPLIVTAHGSTPDR